MLSLLSMAREVGEEIWGFPLKPCGVCVFVFVLGHSYPLQSTPGRQGAPALCAAGSQGDPSPEGCAAVIEYVWQTPPAQPLPADVLPMAQPWPW